MHISVVIPARNEAAHIVSTVAAVHGVLSHGGWRHDIIVVDDRSEDDTRTVVEALSRRYPVRLVANDVGPGKGGALRAGFRRTRGDLVGFIDADLEFPAEALAAMVRTVVDGGDPLHTAVLGVRMRDQRPPFERFTSTFAHWLIRHVLALSVRDSQAGVKLFPGWFAREVLTRAGEVGWLFDAEAVLLAQRQAIHLAEVPVTQARRRPRRAGIGGLLRSVGHVVRIAWRYRVHTDAPRPMVPTGLGA
jgi:dolichol-phosphate mannosyltransferase